MGCDRRKLDEVAQSLSGDARLLPYLPELLQDLWSLGLGTGPTLRLLARAGLDERTDLHVLDLACGKGEALVRLAEQFGWRGTGVDLMPAFINEGRKRAAEHGVSHLVRLQVRDLSEAAANGEPVDLILFGMDSNALGGLADALRAVQRRLAPAGHIVLSTVWERAGRPRLTSALSEEETRHAVQAAGLTLVGEEFLAADWVRSQNEGNTARIRHRASELALRYPDKQGWFDDYVKVQEDESRQLEEDLVCAVLLLRRAGDTRVPA